MITCVSFFPHNKPIAVRWCGYSVVTLHNGLMKTYYSSTGQSWIHTWSWKASDWFDHLWTYEFMKIAKLSKYQEVNKSKFVPCARKFSRKNTLGVNVWSLHSQKRHRWLDANCVYYWPDMQFANRLYQPYWLYQIASSLWTSDVLQLDIGRLAASW